VDIELEEDLLHVPTNCVDRYAEYGRHLASRQALPQQLRDLDLSWG
jgi:hypothetical protein